MTETPNGQPAHPAPAPAAVAPESGHDRMVRGLKTLGIGLLLVVAGIAAVAFMGSQGLTGSAAFVAMALALIGAFFALKGLVLTIWGAVARSRG